MFAGRNSSRSIERMSLNSISTRLPPYSGPVSRGNSQTTQVGAARDIPVTSSDAIDVVELQSGAERKYQEAGAGPGSSTGDTSGSPGGQSSPGIALYQRISQYGNNEPGTSALLKSWNNIMQGSQDADGAVAAFAKTLAQNQTPGSGSGVLDLTA